MATYYQTYHGWFNNRTSNRVDINIYRKDIEPDEVVEFLPEEITGLTIGYPNGEESKYDCLIGCECNIDLRVRADSSITPETFITDYYDEWKVIITCDTLTVFAGFIEPSEGGYIMKDLPVRIQIKCTDGLGLLKNVAISQVDGSTLIGETLTLIEYIAGALKKTNLDLPIRVFSSIYESSMNDRGVDISADMFNQARLDYQTFLSSPTAFENCYKALEIILTGEFALYQWNGYWVISSRTDLLNSVGPIRYYTDYDSDGAIIEGAEDIKSYIEIGKDEQQHPINLDQLISYQVPAKSIHSQYNYVVWPELPRNSKFERGTMIATGVELDTDDINGNGNTSEVIGTFKTFTIDDWIFGGFAVGPTQMSSLPALIGSTPDSAYRKSVYNQFGIEIQREIIIDKTTGVTNWLYSQPIPAYAGDKLGINFDFRLSSDTGQLTIATAIVYIIDASGNKWWWRARSAAGTNVWEKNNSAATAIFVDFESADDATKYKSENLTSPPIPVNGTMYVVLENVWDDNMPNKVYYKNFEFNYFPFIAGGYVQVKGDYWLTSQTANIKDTQSDEILISDAPKKVFKGALLRSDGSLTTPTWTRYPGTETKHYKEIINLTKYNHYYRRFRKITGSFKGIKSHSENFMGDFFPIGFHKHYVFINNDTTRYYVIVPPVSLNYVTGQWSGQAIECFKDGDFEQLGDTHEFNFIFG